MSPDYEARPASSVTATFVLVAVTKVAATTTNIAHEAALSWA